MSEDKGILIEMPSGEAGFYCDDEHPTVPHSYWRANQKKVKGVVGWHRGRRLTGVTTATKILDVDPAKLLRWAARTNGIGVATLAAPLIMDLRDGRPYSGELDWLLSAEDIWEALTGASLTFEDVREERSEIGRNIHRYAFQALAEGQAVPQLDVLTTEERGWAQAVVGFWLDHDPDGQLVEAILLDHELGIAGRTDFIGTLATECEDESCACHELDGRGVIDAKTGNYLAASDHAQVQGYRLLSVRAGYGPTEWGALLKLREDGTYSLIRAEGAPEDFITAVDAYRTAARIDREAAKTREGKQK